MNRIFRIDGPVMTFLTKFGQLVILTVLWLITSLPVLTVTGASSSLYYSVMKAVRKENGYPVREYFNNFKRTFWDGIVFSFGFILIFYVMHINLAYIQAKGGNSQFFMTLIYYVLICFVITLFFYLFPVLSRFAVSKRKMISIACSLMLLRLPYSALIFAFAAGLLYAFLHWLPAACVLFLPGVLCYLLTFVMEPALRKMMAPPKEGEEKWFDE